MKKIALLSVLIILSQAYAKAQTADILFNPQATNVTAGQTFDVAVRVDIHTGSVNAVSIHFDFDETRLQITNIQRPSSGLFTFEAVSLPAPPYTSFNTTGHVEYEAGIPGGTSTSTDFDILLITFETVDPPVTGITPLTFSTGPFPHITRAVNITPLTVSLINGTVNITNCTPPTATISSSAPITICDGQPVGLTLSAATGVSPYDITVNGTIYTDVTVGTQFASIPFESSRLFPADPTPNTQLTNDNGLGSGIEYGFRFMSSTDGFINGLRFFRPSGNGTYTAKLYNSDRSVLLAYVDFPAGGQGWVSVNFTDPVAITASTEYTATVYSSSGDYAVTENGYNAAVVSGSLTGFQGNGGINGTTSNGLYTYGTGVGGGAVPAPGISGTGTGGTPSGWLSYQNGNYFVDVLFTASTNTIHFTQIVDDSGCPNTGAPDLQTLVINSVSCETLPVTLLNLSASPDGNKVKVSWTTTTEINNRGFDVERSTDGVSWTKVGFVAGVGNSTMANTYHFVDYNLESKRYFYRLKQIDFDERYKYSTVVSAVVGSRSEYSLGQNYPNPFSNLTTIQYVIPQREDVLLTVHDAGGRLVKVLVNGVKEAGTHAINFNQQMLPSGMYYYKIVAGEFIQMKKMVIR